MVIVIVLAVVLIGVPLLLWGLNRLRGERPDRSGVADGRGSNNLVGVLFVFFTIGFGIALLGVSYVVCALVTGLFIREKMFDPSAIETRVSADAVNA